MLSKGCDALSTAAEATGEWNWGGNHSNATKARIIAATDSVIAVLTDADTAFACDPNQQLACWLKDAEEWGSTEDERGALRTAARRQLTIWGPVVGDNANLVDYAEKPWAGLMRDYYAMRWRTYAQVALSQMQQGKSISLWGDMTTELIAAEKAFGTSSAPGGVCGPAADAASVARRMRARYFPRLRPGAFPKC